METTDNTSIAEIEVGAYNGAGNVEDIRVKCRDLALKFRDLWDKLPEHFEPPAREGEQKKEQHVKRPCYILSAKWLREWKEYIAYDQILADQEPGPAFQQAKPGLINEDLLRAPEDIKAFLQFPGSSTVNHYTNVVLREGILENEHYHIISDKIWNFLRETCEGVEILRYLHFVGEEASRVEVHLKQVKIILLTSQFAKELSKKEIKELPFCIVQTSAYRRMREFQEDLALIVAPLLKKKIKFWFDTLKPDLMRLWKVNPEETRDSFQDFVLTKLLETTSYEVKMQFPGEYVGKEPELRLDHARIADNDLIVLEFKTSTTSAWIFYGDGIENEGRCQNCYEFKPLKTACKCKQASYCSVECLNKDKPSHQRRCQALESEEEVCQFTESSRRGICGLQNLGNTCFMNSGLQCLSNTYELTKYFLDGKYKSEINKANRLGTRGELAKRYALFLRHVWCESSSTHSPWNLKQAIGDFQPMFSGYAQHDSQELISYVLDGLHEDLNRVKEKPYIPTLENEGRPDEEIARESWKNHLKRNNSVIVDFMHGQLRSQLTCPNCQRISITYDPFMICSLPIPTTTLKTISLTFIHHFSAMREQKTSPYFRMKFEYAKDSHKISDLRTSIAAELGVPSASFYLVLASQFGREDVNDSDLTHQVRKKAKRGKPLYAIQYSEEELLIPAEERVPLEIEIERVTTGSYKPIRRSCANPRVIFVRKTMTAAEVHTRIFKMFRNIIESNLPKEKIGSLPEKDDVEAKKILFESFGSLLYTVAEEQESEEREKQKEKEKGDKVIRMVFPKKWETQEARDEISKKGPYEIYINSKGKWGSYTCYWCAVPECPGCTLPDSNELTIDTCLEKAAENDKRFALQVVFTANCEKFTFAGSNDGADDNKAGATGQKQSKTINLTDCLKFFEYPEQLDKDNAWYCNKCKEHVQAVKKMVLYKTPNVLILHLKRFKTSKGHSVYSSTRKKNEEFISIPMDLDLTDYVLNKERPNDFLAREKQQNGGISIEQPAKAGEAGQGENSKMEDEEEKVPTQEQAIPIEVREGRVIYELYAISNHYGGLGGGHYTAYVKNYLNGQWYGCDDSSVRQASPQQVVSSAAYVLFYRRRES